MIDKIAEAIAGPMIGAQAAQNAATRVMRLLAEQPRVSFDEECLPLIANFESLTFDGNTFYALVRLNNDH